MSKLSKVLLLLLSVIVLTQCEQDNWGSYYDRPTWLGPPIYQTLVQNGDFTMFVKCIDRTGYALDRSGSYTVFAPNDEAFAAYLADKGLASVDDLDEQTATDIVSYALIINPYTIEGLNRFEDATYGSPTGAFKRQTMYYPILKKGNVRMLVDGVYEVFESYYVDQNTLYSNTDGSIDATAGWVSTELNNKYYPYFLTEYEDFGAEDYGALFGDESRYTGRNAYDAQMVGDPISAENGWIYELDRVVEPVPSLDAYLQLEDYSDFYSLFVERNKVGFVLNSSLTTKYTGNADYPDLESVYTKLYAGDLPFAPNVEIYTRAEGVQDAQKNGFTILAPNNAALGTFYASFENTYGLSFTDMLEAGYSDVLAVFLGNHMIKSMTWPRNSGEQYNTEVRLASNGIFYGRNRVEQGAYFTTVYAEIFLNPKYLEMKRALTRFASSIRDEMLNDQEVNNKFTVLLMNNTLLGPNGDGMVYDPTLGNFLNDNILAISGAAPISPNGRMTRLIEYHIFKRTPDAVIPSDFAGSAWKYAANYNLDFVRYRQGSLQGLGNIELNTFVTPTLLNRSYVNGQVFDIDRLLEATPRDSVNVSGVTLRTSMWVDRPKVESLSRIKTVAGDDNGDDLTWYMTNCSTFLTWLKNAQVNSYNKLLASNKRLTILIPTNAAIQAAIADGFFSGVTYAEATDTSLWHNNLDGLLGTDDDRDSLRILRQVQYFVAQHVLQGVQVAEDLLPNYVSFYNQDKTTNMAGSSLEVNRKKNTVIITKVDGSLIFTSRRADMSTNSVAIDASSSNTYNIIMGGMMVHKIAADGYLKYDKPASMF